MAFGDAGGSAVAALKREHLQRQVSAIIIRLLFVRDPQVWSHPSTRSNYSAGPAPSEPQVFPAERQCDTGVFSGQRGRRAGRP